MERVRLMPRPLPEPIAAKLGRLLPAGEGWKTQCPAHDDSRPSLSVTFTADDKLLAFCHAGCPQDEVLRLIDYESTKTNGSRGDDRYEAIYSYRDEEGNQLFQVCRTRDKDFPQRRPDPTKHDGWAWGLGNTRRVLYRLPELVQARDAGKSICIAEGEKDVEALVRHGRVATCNPGGAGKWRDEYAAFFTDADVTIFADADKPGQAHARTIAASLAGVARRVWVVEPRPPHKDIAAHLAAGLKLDQVEVTHEVGDDAIPDAWPELDEFMASRDPDHDWIIPDLLDRGDRLMLTGFEGLGKSVLLCQFVVCMAAGIDPFTFARIPPRRVCFLDCENSERQVRSHLRPLVQQAARDGRPVVSANLRLGIKPEGVDLPSANDAAWLLERVVAYKPDVLVVGPLYRLHYDNPNNEEVARRLVGAIDAARTRVDCAVIIEAHSGHGEWGRNRSVRPVGSSLYLRWPEFGYGLRPTQDQTDERNPSTVEVVPWRGPRSERNWPEQLRRSTGWPWTPHVPTAPIGP